MGGVRACGGGGGTAAASAFCKLTSTAAATAAVASTFCFLASAAAAAAVYQYSNVPGRRFSKGEVDVFPGRRFSRSTFFRRPESWNSFVLKVIFCQAFVASF
jgi:hypothetical protein